MRIAIRTSNVDLARQGHAYVEYRMFSAISRFGLDHARLRVHLKDDHAHYPAARYRCSALLEWAPAGRIRVRTAADRLYGAVDAAADHLTDRVECLVGDKSLVGGDTTSAAQAPIRRARGR
jgi:ribosome-associated translation inhibitor RaiA